MQKYEQVKVLGEGGFGKAILARQKSDGRMCVIKEVRLSSLKTKDREEALKEAKVLASLKHPNIVQYITSFQERGCFYIVMEYADGGDLSQKIEKRKNRLFTEDEILHDFIQICLAIKYIHDRKILHRDLKTQNIFLTKEGDVKLGDFGIASVLEHTFQLCRTQIGTPYYLSPEICEGRSYNAKTDIWSLGCILYELCTLQHAFQGMNIKSLMLNICRGKVNPINRMYSDDLKSLIRSMLTTDPKKRPTINQILALPFIKSRLSSLLDKTILDYEFSHTVLHGRKPLAAPTVVLSKNKEPHNLIDDYEDEPKENKNDYQKENKPTRSASAQKQKDQVPSRENRSPSRQKQIQQMQQQRANLPTGADPRYYQRQQRQQAAAIPDNVDPRYARRQQMQQQKIEEEARKKEANERERQRLKQAEEQRRMKQKQKEKEEEERRIQKQQEIERERRRLEEQKKQDEEKRRKQLQQQALQERRKRLQEDIEKKKEEERLRKRIEADEARRRSEEEERERQREQIKMKQDMREQQRKRREEEEADIKRRDDERKRQRLIEQQREKEELEAEKAQIMEEEKQKKLAAIRKQRELREEQKRQLEEDKKRKQQQEEDIMKDNGYLEFQGEKEQIQNQQRRRQNRRIAPSYSEDEIPARRQRQRPKWVDPEGRSYNDDDENNDLSEPPPMPPQSRQRKPTWASRNDDDEDDNQYNRQPQQRQQQRKERPAWVSPTDNDYDNQYNQQQQIPPRKKQKPAWVSPSGEEYNEPQNNQAIEEPAWAKMPPKKMSIYNKPKQKKFDDMSQEERNEYMRQIRHEAQANRQKASKIDAGEYDKQAADLPNEKPARNQINKNQQQQEQQPKQNVMNKKFDDMTQEERNEYMRQLRHEAQANRQKANKIELEEGDDDQNLQEINNPRKSSPPVQQQQQPKQNVMNKKFDDMTQEERNEYMRQLRHEAQANRQKANKIELEEGDDDQILQEINNPRKSSPPVQQQSKPQQQPQPPRPNIMNKKFDDMSQEERNEYMRQLRHEAQANRQKANKIQLEEGDDEQGFQNNNNNNRKSSPPVQQQYQQQEQPPKPNIINKKFDDMTQEERNEYMRQLRHEAQANRQKANRIQLEEGDDDQNIQNANNNRQSSPPVQQQPPRKNIMNKKFDDMSQEERNEYMRQLRHEAQANRQKANKIQLEEGDDEQDFQNVNKNRKSSPPVQQQQQPQQLQPPRKNIINKKFDDMSQEERNEYMRQLRHEAQANRQKANKIQLEEGDDEQGFLNINNNNRKSSPPVQQQYQQQEQPPKPNIMNKKFDDMTQEERNEYMRQLRHEAQANRQKANRIQLEEGDDQSQYNNGNDQKQPRQRQQQDQPPKQNVMNKKFDDMTQEERNEYMRQLRHEAQANRQKANRIQLEEGDDQNENNYNARPPAQPAARPNLNNKKSDDMTIEERNEYARQLRHEAAENRKRAMFNNADEGSNNNNNYGEYANIKDERIAKHEISEEDRRRIYEEQRAAFKAYRSRGRILDNGADAREALEDPSYVNQPPPKDERIAKHEISEEDRRRIYEEQRAAFKAYRNRGRLLDKGADVRDAIEDPDYVNQPPPKDERIAKHEISEEDRRRIYEEQRAAFKAYRSRGRDIDNGAEVRDAIEDPDYVNQPPPKDERIAKHEISEEDRRRIYEEQRAAFKAYRSRGRDIDNGAEVRDAIEDPDYVYQPPPKDDRIAKHQISEEDRRRIYEEQRAAFKAYKNRGRVVDSFVEEPSFEPSSQEKKKPKNVINGHPSNDLYYIDDDDTEGYNFNSNLYYNKNKNKQNNAKPSGGPKAAMFSPDFDDEEYDNTPQWAKNPSRHIPINNNNKVKQKQSLAQQEPPPGSPRFYDAVNEDEDDAYDDNVKVYSPQINNVKKASPIVAGNKRMIQLDNIIDNNNDDDDYNEDYGFYNQENKEEIRKAEKNVEKLQRYAFSLKEALNLPEQKSNNFDDDDADNNDYNDQNDGKENQVFYIQDKQLSLPVASNDESKNNRINTIRNYLEKQIGLQKLSELNNELINKAQNDSAPTPIINDLPPGLVCLAEQLLVLDGQNQNNNV